MRTHYDILETYSLTKQLLSIDDELFESMWELFVQIGEFWENGDFLDPPENHDSYKLQLLAFMNNRITLDPAYFYEYENAQKVIAELKETRGEDAFKTLFTAQVDPNTLLGHARLKVSNEFVLFQLAVGGFKAFGAENYPGYFGGANIPGQTPYRTGE